MDEKSARKRTDSQPSEVVEFSKNEKNGEFSKNSEKGKNGEFFKNEKNGEFLKKSEINKGGVITNRIPEVIFPEEISSSRLILRRDRLTHFEEIGAVVNRMRNEKKNFDCFIFCEKEQIKTHRSVLISHSGFFRKILWENGDNLTVDVPTDGIPVREMTSVLDFMYTGDLKINYQNAIDILATANILQMNQLSETCSDFIAILLADENLMTTLELAEGTGINLLYVEAYKRLAKNFYVQTKMPGFLLWDFEKVHRLLSNDHIVIETELHVFTAAMRWMQFKESDRRQFFKGLMDCVRWVYLSTDAIMNCIDQESDLLKQSNIRILLIDANWFVTLQSYNFIWKDYVIPLPRIKSLRKEDPEEVVQRMRVSLVAKHSSFDQIWKPKKSTKDQTSTGRKSTPKTDGHTDKALVGAEKSNLISPKKLSAVDAVFVRSSLKNEKLPKNEIRNKKSALAERFSLFKKVKKTVKR